MAYQDKDGKTARQADEDISSSCLRPCDVRLRQSPYITKKRNKELPTFETPADNIRRKAHAQSLKIHVTYVDVSIKYLRCSFIFTFATGTRP